MVDSRQEALFDTPNPQELAQQQAEQVIAGVQPIAPGYQDELDARVESSAFRELGGGSRETLAADPPRLPKKRSRRNRPIESRFTDIGSDLQAIMDAGEKFDAEGGEDNAATDSGEPILSVEESKTKIDRIIKAGLVRRTLDDAGNDANYSTALLRARTKSD